MYRTGAVAQPAMLYGVRGRRNLMPHDRAVSVHRLPASFAVGGGSSSSSSGGGGGSPPRLGAFKVANCARPVGAISLRACCRSLARARQLRSASRLPIGVVGPRPGTADRLQIVARAGRRLDGADNVARASPSSPAARRPSNCR